MADFALSAEIDLRTRNLTQVIRQIQSGIGSAKGNIDIGVSQRSQSNISRVNKSLATTNRTLKTTSKEAKVATDSIENFGKQSALAIRRFAAFTIVTTGFINFSKSVKQSIADAVDFQREMIKISQVTGRTYKGLGDLNKEITRLSTSLGTSSAELLQAARTLSQTGISADQVRKSLQAIAKSDLSPTFDSITDTTEGTVAIFRQFGVEADSLEKKLSSINSVSKSFAIESGDVITAVRRSGGAFAAAGGNFEEFISLLTSVRSTTRESAESIATGFRTIFTRLQRTRTQNFLKELGINLRNADNQFVGPFEAIQKLSFALKDLQGTDPRFAQIIEELGGFRQVTKVIPLIKEFETSEAALNVAIKQNNSLSEDAAIAQESLANKISKLREQFEALIRTLADSKSFEKIADTILTVANAAIKLSEALVPLLPALTAIAAISGVKFSQKFFGSATGGGFTGTLLKRNIGGGVPGTGTHDTVPALLTPGEFVLSTDAVDAIGEKRLTNFNNAARHANGGLVGSIKSKITGNPALSAAGGALIFQSLAGLFKGLDDETQKTVATFASLAIQAGILNTAIKSNVDATKRNTEIQDIQSKIEKGNEVKDNLTSTQKSLSKDRFNIQNERFDREAALKSRTIAETKAAREISNELGARDFELSSKRSSLDNRLTSLQPKSGGIDLPSTSAERKKIEQEIEEISKQQFTLEQDKANALSQNNKLISQRKIEQGRINNLKTQEAGLSERNERIERSIEAVERNRIANAKKLEAAKKAAVRSQRITQGIAAGGLLAGTAGQFISQAGSSSIQEGGTNPALSATGGALSGIASGAAIGALFGPIGAGIGAVGGGLIGLATSLKEASSQIEQVQFKRVADEINGALEAIKNGSSTAEASSFNISNRLRDIGNRQLLNAGDSEASRNIQSDVDRLLPGVSIFLSRLATGSKTFEEFNKRGEEAIKFLARQQNLPIDEINKKYAEQIKAQNKASQINDDVLRQREMEVQRLRELNIVSIAVANSFRDLEKVQSGLASQASFLSNSIQTGGFRNTAAGFSSLSTVGDISSFEEDAKNIGKLFGDAGERIANELVAGAQVSKRLPDILTRLKEQDPLGQSGEFVTRFEEELSDVPKFIRDSYVSMAKDIVGSEGNDVNIISEVKKDLLGTAKKLSSGIEETFGKPLEEAGTELANRKNAFSQGLAQIQQAIDAAGQRRFQAVDVGQQLLQTRLQRPLTESESNQEFIKKLDIIAGNGPKTVDAIVKALGPARQNLKTARERFSNLSDGDKVGQVQDNFKKAGEEVVRLTNSLKFLADSTILVSNAQKELNDAEQQRLTEQGFLETLLAGTPEQQQVLAKQLNATNILIALQKENNLKNTPSNILQQALPLLKAAPNASFQGVKFEDLLKETLKALTPAGLEGFGQEGSKGKSARERLIDALKQQQKANEELAKLYRNTGNNIADAIKPLLSDFITDIKKAFIDAEERAAANEKNRVLGDLRTAETKKADIQLASQVFEVSPKEILQIKAASGELKRFAEISKDIKSLRLLKNPIFDFSEFGGKVKRSKSELTTSGQVYKKLDKAGEILGERGFNQDQVSEFKKRFLKLAGPELKPGNDLTAEEAQKFLKEIVSDISQKAADSLEEEQKRLENVLESNTLFDTEAERNKILKNIELFGEELQRVDEKFAESTVDKYRESLKLINDKIDSIPNVPLVAPKPQQQQVPQLPAPQQIEPAKQEGIVPPVPQQVKQQQALTQNKPILATEKDFTNSFYSKQESFNSLGGAAQQAESMFLKQGYSEKQTDSLISKFLDRGLDITEKDKDVNTTFFRRQDAADIFNQLISENPLEQLNKQSGQSDNTNNPFEKRRAIIDRRNQSILERGKKQADIRDRRIAYNSSGKAFETTTAGIEKRLARDKVISDAIERRNQEEADRIDQTRSARNRVAGTKSSVYGSNRFGSSSVMENQEKFKRQAEEKRQQQLQNVRDRQDAYSIPAYSESASFESLSDAQQLRRNQEKFRKAEEERRQKIFKGIQDLNNGIYFGPTQESVSKPVTNEAKGVIGTDFKKDLEDAYKNAAKAFDFASVKDAFDNFKGGFDDGTDRIKSASETLLEISKVIPKDINFTGNLKLDVILNGAEVLGQIQPELAKMVKTAVKDAFIKSNNNKALGIDDNE